MMGLWCVLLAACAVVSGASATIPKGQFACPSAVQAAWKAGTDTCGAWYSTGSWDTTGAQADLTYANSAITDERVLFQAIPIPSTNSYQFSFQAKFTSTTQLIYCQVLGIKTGTSISLTANGVPKVISQTGVKSFLLVTPAATNGNGNWYTYSGTVAISASDAAAYQYVGIAMVGARAAGMTLQFDNVSSDMPALSTDSSAGLQVDWFNLANPTNMSTISWTNPARTTQEEQINWINTPATTSFLPGFGTTNFGFHATGNIKIPTTGSWTFYLGSDDGSSLRINGTLLILAPGSQGFTTRSATVTLVKGAYPIEVYYFEGGGPKGCVLSWLGPGMAAQDVIPYSAFSKTVRVTRWVETGQDGE